MQIEISTRHGGLEPEQQRYLHDKAEKLLKYFGRLMAIEVAVDHGKHGVGGGDPGLGRAQARLCCQGNGVDAGSGDGSVCSQDRAAASPLQGEGPAPQRRCHPWRSISPVVRALPGARGGGNRFRRGLSRLATLNRSPHGSRDCRRTVAQAGRRMVAVALTDCRRVVDWTPGIRRADGGPSLEGRMKLLDFVVRESIIVDLQATGKEQAIREMVGSLHRAGRLAKRRCRERDPGHSRAARSSARRASVRAWRFRTRGIRRFIAWSERSPCRAAASISPPWTASRSISFSCWSRPRTSPATI